MVWGCFVILELRIFIFYFLVIFPLFLRTFGDCLIFCIGNNASITDKFIMELVLFFEEVIEWTR